MGHTDRIKASIIFVENSFSAGGDYITQKENINISSTSKYTTTCLFNLLIGNTLRGSSPISKIHITVLSEH